MPAILAKKLGMTQLFLEDGTVAPATVLQAGPCIVVQQKTAQADGYEAVQIGLVESRAPRANKAGSGHFKRANNSSSASTILTEASTSTRLVPSQVS